MNKKRKRLLYVYSVIIFIVGILEVPVRSVWGPDRELDICKYVPIWNLVNKSVEINGFTPIYEIDIQGLIVSLVVITIITLVLYLTLDGKD